MFRSLLLSLLPGLLLASSVLEASGRRESCSNHADCGTCASSQSWLGTACRWCPIDRACHEPGSLVNKCSSSQEVVDPGRCQEPDNGHYEFDARLSELAAAISGAAYAPEPGPCLANFPPTAQAGGRLVDVTKITVACDMLHDECSGFVGRLPDKKLIVVVFRGTTGNSQLMLEGLMSLAMPKQASPIGGKVQAYFSSGFDALWPQMHEAVLGLMRANPDHSLLVTGHSLGGAMASLAAASLAAIDSVAPSRLAFYSFGEPRVGDYFFARAFDRLVPNSWRVVHGNDLIVHLPICSPVMLSARRSSSLTATPFSCSGHLGFPYHHGTEVFFPRTADMQHGSDDYRVCTGTPINEDSSCANASDNWRSCLSPSKLMECAEAHKVYYGIHLGGWWKENQCTNRSFMGAR